MRKLLLLALLLYDILALGTRQDNYDYDENDKRHSLDDRRNWRKKALQPADKDWDDRRRHDYESPRYDELEGKSFGGDRRDSEPNYRRRYEEVDKLNMALGGKSAELGHSYLEKDIDKKPPSSMNCDRPHERYESCFAGCASVTCDNPRDRLRPCYPFCEPGCVCIPPYVRDDRTHKCVMPEDCSKGLKGIPDLGEEMT